MEIQSLPRFHGLPDAGIGWGEPDGHGKRPSMGLRDYMVSTLLIIGFLMFVSTAAVEGWRFHRRAESLNPVRERQVEAAVEDSSW
jgi:hypothetical protein